jgi:hypothetical protein
MANPDWPAKATIIGRCCGIRVNEPAYKFSGISDIEGLDNEFGEKV